MDVPYERDAKTRSLICHTHHFIVQRNLLEENPLNHLLGWKRKCMEKKSLLRFRCRRAPPTLMGEKSRKLLINISHRPHERLAAVRIGFRLGGISHRPHEHLVAGRTGFRHHGHCWVTQQQAIESRQRVPAAVVSGCLMVLANFCRVFMTNPQ